MEGVAVRWHVERNEAPNVDGTAVMCRVDTTATRDMVMNGKDVFFFSFLTLQYLLHQARFYRQMLDPLTDGG